MGGRSDSRREVLVETQKERPWASEPRSCVERASVDVTAVAALVVTAGLTSGVIYVNPPVEATVPVSGLVTTTSCAPACRQESLRWIGSTRDYDARCCHAADRDGCVTPNPVPMTVMGVPPVVGPEEGETLVIVRKCGFRSESGAKTGFASSVTWVCASALPYNTAPVSSMIAFALSMFPLTWSTCRVSHRSHRRPARRHSIPWLRLEYHFNPGGEAARGSNAEIPRYLEYPNVAWSTRESDVGRNSNVSAPFVESGSN